MDSTDIKQANFNPEDCRKYLVDSQTILAEHQDVPTAITALTQVVASLVNQLEELTNKLKT